MYHALVLFCNLSPCLYKNTSTLFNKRTLYLQTSDLYVTTLKYIIKTDLVPALGIVILPRSIKNLFVIVQYYFIMYCYPPRPMTSYGNGNGNKAFPFPSSLFPFPSFSEICFHSHGILTGGKEIPCFPFLSASLITCL